MRFTDFCRNVVACLIVVSAQSVQADDAGANAVSKKSSCDNSTVKSTTDVPPVICDHGYHYLSNSDWNIKDDEQPVLVVEYVDGKKATTLRSKPSLLHCKTMKTGEGLQVIPDDWTATKEEEQSCERANYRLDAFLSGRTNTYAGYDAETNF